MKVEKGITVRMRDGVKISLCVYRPDAEGRFPALFAASPYQYEMDEVPAYPLFLWRETGPVEWYVGQGYAYVHADVRGSGRSEGEFEFMGPNEQRDYLELIAWIVGEPWCSGRVGGIGQSYYAMAQWLMATYNPPGLACIAPYDGLVDQYRGSNYHGGIFCSYRSVWYTSLRADNQHRLAGRHGRPPMKFDLVGAITEHSLDDDFWRVRSPFWRLGEIKCPVLSVGHWGKMGLHLRGNILGYEEVKAPKKLVVTGARNTFEAHRMFDQVEFHEKELLPFYDLHLKGKNNGFMEAEPVKLFVRGANAWSADEEWPPRATSVAYYLRRSGAASPDLHHGTARGRSRCDRTGRAEAFCVVDRDRYSVHRQAHRPASARCGRARQERAAGLYAGVEGLAESLASREGCRALKARAAVLYPHQSAAA
jgi:predicted acyl esterase